MFSSNGGSNPAPVVTSSPQIDVAGEQMVIRPPSDPSLTMVVVERRTFAVDRGPASAEGASAIAQQSIDVIVSAP